MKSAVTIVASSFGVFAGIGALEHGVFEIMQGSIRPVGVMINSIGPPCQPEQIWNACEPAMTVIPNYLITGVLAILFGLIGIIWSLFFIERKHGGLVLMLLSFAMLLFGGGIFPPLIGMIGGLVGTRINKSRRADSSIRALAVLWPWMLILFFVLLFGQWIVGAVSNQFMTLIMVPNLILVLILLILSVLSAFAHEVQKHTEVGD